jgi:hypothetical protein
MDSESDKLRGELDAAMAEVKAAREKRDPATPPSPIGSIINPPSQVLPELKNDALSYALLETRIEELQRKMASRTLQYEAEVKAHERLKARVETLMTELAALEDQAASHQREAAVSATLAEELSETLKVAAEARSQLAMGLDEERRQRVRLAEQGAKLQEEVDRLRPDLARKEEALSSALKGLEEAKRIAAQEIENRARDQQRFATEVEQAKVRAAVSAAEAEKTKQLLLDKESALSSVQAEAESLRESGLRGREAVAELERLRREIQIEREKLETEKNRALEQAEAVRREGGEALEAAQELKSQTRLQAEQQRSALEEERKRLLAEFKSAMKEVNEFKTDLKVRSEKELSDLRAQMESERAKLYAQIDDERQRLKKELSDRVEAERLRARSDREALLRQETLKTQKAAERDRMKGDLQAKPAAPAAASPGLSTPVAPPPAPAAPVKRAAPPPSSFPQDSAEETDWMERALLGFLGATLAAAAAAWFFT